VGRSTARANTSVARSAGSRVIGTLAAVVGAVVVDMSTPECSCQLVVVVVDVASWTRVVPVLAVSAVRDSKVKNTLVASDEGRMVLVSGAEVLGLVVSLLAVAGQGGTAVCWVADLPG
jgi:hypothetical protein